VSVSRPPSRVPRSRSGRVPAVAVVAGALAFAFAVVGCSTTETDSTGSKGYVAGDGTVTLYDAGNRAASPNLTGPLLGGGQASLSSYRGKVVVLNHWSSWCSPCRQEAPALEAAAKALPQAAFLGIDTRDSSALALAFEHAQHVSYPSFSDEDGSLLLLLAHAVPINALPCTLVIDKQGRIAARIIGPTSALTIEEIVRPLEKESG
jgi:thiol-disulfide isomerase/thioredoxin